ncbi:hypothetical protein FFLO_05785 [Filobasidium floriforme]|uniref:Uncharacterized protein n=1 Tax=Filobasidium floriforme TaxID=5210 RepID=A0A8K0JHY3_9TREE|nr:uncharacterized protein HD553DRAFT_367935 [Filobasidium floriforme]KAG7529144.1 hypothetical protein FFLO_05785 [Filobasidium floriforme]KAH8087298.1 hypothetical protein HD553DRAFT_367935 [Filobasidium floriforme]
MASLPEQPLQLSKPVSFDVTPLQRYLEFRFEMTGASLAGEFRTAGYPAEQIIQVRLFITGTIVLQHGQQSMDLAEIVVNAKDCFPDTTQDANGYKDLVKELLYNWKFLPYAAGHLNDRLCELRNRRNAEKSLDMDITPITYPPGSEVEHPETLLTPKEPTQSSDENSVHEGSDSGTMQTRSGSFISSFYKSLASAFKLSRKTN